MEKATAISSVGAAIGDPVRSRILLALMGGQAMTATELAVEGGVAPSTASSHLGRLLGRGLIRRVKQGRHRYYEIAGAQIAEVIERLCGLDLENLRDHGGRQFGPKDAALRRARVCYDHLAGEVAVELFEKMVGSGWLELSPSGIGLSPQGEREWVDRGLPLPAGRVRRPLCLKCLDWSERRYHLAGVLGAELLAAILDRGWAERDLVGRAVRFSPSGEHELKALFR